MSSTVESIEHIDSIVKSYMPKTEGLQKTVYAAMNDAVDSGGKRIRPLLIFECCKTFGTREGFGREEYIKLAAPFMAAMEMIHTSSLIHDDLPCMDNDTLRRGKPTTWVSYGEDMAVLAGDALIVEAMDVAASAICDSEHPSRSARAFKVLTAKTGMKGMIGGQVVDVEKTGQPLNKEELEFIYKLKTGALIEGSMLIGAILGGANDKELDKISQIALDVGIAFQIQDDILDETATTEQIGKPAHSDDENNKTTYVSIHGIDKARAKVEELTREAIYLLDSLSADTAGIREIIQKLMNRNK